VNVVIRNQFSLPVISALKPATDKDVDATKIRHHSSLSL